MLILHLHANYIPLNCNNKYKMVTYKYFLKSDSKAVTNSVSACGKV